jgi:hypothetical protein
VIEAVLWEVDTEYILFEAARAGHYDDFAEPP